MQGSHYEFIMNDYLINRQINPMLGIGLTGKIHFSWIHLFYKRIQFFNWETEIINDSEIKLTNQKKPQKKWNNQKK